jgi:DNA-binding NarL/FixJ family response regulator
MMTSTCPTCGSQAAPPDLSEEDRVLWRLVAQGLPSADIGRALFMSERTTRRRIAALLDTLGVSTRVQAAALAGRCGVVDL